ncbi:MAG TPA: hypothetical protein VNX18_19595 [Bryobacteraceae bacterium]|jgi:hypothetical protein|nr:hypothetical protein [Bryobacteraceae bacterium]
MANISPRVLLAFLAIASLQADQKKLTLDQRVEIMRGLMAEYATVKVVLPRSKKPLDVQTDGTYSKQQWADAMKELGPAGRVGDLVQVTHVEIEKDAILLQINGGTRGKGSWKDHVSIGMGGGTSPINGGQATNAPGGTNVALRFGEPIGEVTSAEVKKMLATVLQFDKQTVTEQAIDTVTPEVKKAIGEKKPIEGMSRDEVIMAVGKPVRKSRESKDGVDYEDWIYGNPPGKVMFVTFSGAKVVKVKETYAGLGGTIAETPKP